MKPVPTHCVHTYVHINAYAWAYAAATNPAEKREALRDYLYWLRMLAIEASDNIGSYANFEPLVDLVENLCQVDNGEYSKLLTPSKGSGAPPTIRAAQWQWARASALITVLMKKFNKDEDEAARITVRKLKELGIPAPGRGSSSAVKSLKDWRDKLMAGKKGEQAREWYDLALIVPERGFPQLTESATIQILLRPSVKDYAYCLTY